MESELHRTLKLAAVQRLLRDGCVAAATEVRCPIARFRVDAAGYVDPLPKRRRVAVPPPPALHEDCGPPIVERGDRAATVIVECKQSRADFLTDSRDCDRLLRSREQLNAVRRALEDRIVKVCEPHLRRSGSSLFVDLEEWDFVRSEVPSYQRVLEELRALDERLYGQSKFWTIARYRLADRLYIAAPRGLIRRRELPEGWGLLELVPAVHGARADADETSLRAAFPAPPHPGSRRHRLRLLRNIAVAATRSSVRAESRHSVR